MTLATYQDVSGSLDEAVRPTQPQKTTDVVELIDVVDRGAGTDAVWRQARLLRDEWRIRRYRRLSGG